MLANEFMFQTVIADEHRDDDSGTNTKSIDLHCEATKILSGIPMTRILLSIPFLGIHCLLRTAGIIAMSLCLLMITATAQGQGNALSGIAGGTPAVRSSKVLVDTLLKIAGVRATDFLVDLGSGDGHILITAAKEYGARGFGVDHDSRLVALANESARMEGVDDRIKFIQQDLLQTDLGLATVISICPLDDYSMALRPRLLALKPGTRLVSRDWKFGDWDADIKIQIRGNPAGTEKAGWIYLWVVPAKIGGRWFSRVPSETGWIDAEFRFDQYFQKISGEAIIGASKLAIERASLSGDFVSFRIQNGKQTVLFNGLVQSGRIVGQVMLSGGRALRWRALKS